MCVWVMFFAFFVAQLTGLAMQNRSVPLHKDLRFLFKVMGFIHV